MNPDRSRVELYDIPDDPIEMNNLAGSRKDVVERMAERLLAWQKTLPNGPIDPTAGKNAYPWPAPKPGTIPRSEGALTKEKPSRP